MGTFERLPTTPMRRNGSLLPLTSFITNSGNELPEAPRLLFAQETEGQPEGECYRIAGRAVDARHNRITGPQA